MLPLRTTTPTEIKSKPSWQPMKQKPTLLSKSILGQKNRLMRIRLYADEDAMAHRLARELRLRGLDITTALDEGMIERP